MSLSSDPIPDRLRGAGLVMNALALPIALMPLGLVLGANLDGGLGITLAGKTVAILPSMLPWLAPVATGTFLIGMLVYFGRALREGFVVAVAWALGLATVAPPFAIVATVVAYAIWSGGRRLQELRAVERAGR